MFLGFLHVKNMVHHSNLIKLVLYIIIYIMFFMPAILNRNNPTLSKLRDFDNVGLLVH